MDAFQRAVDDSRRQLGQAEGKQVSVSELLRRAGFPEVVTGDGLTMKGARYHLDPGNNRARKGGHRVPAELVTRLANVLPVSEEALQRAAQIAAGFTEPTDSGRDDVADVLVRYLGDEGVAEQEKAETTARLLSIIAEQSARNARNV